MLSDILSKKAPEVQDLRYSKAGKPTSLELAEAIETLRDLLFRQFGVNYSFTVSGDGYVLGASHPGITVHAVVNK
jgi:hypothetical protein